MVAVLYFTTFELPSTIAPPNHPQITDKIYDELEMWTRQKQGIVTSVDE